RQPVFQPEFIQFLGAEIFRESFYWIEHRLKSDFDLLHITFCSFCVDSASFSKFLNLDQAPFVGVLHDFVYTNYRIYKIGVER
ncbi:MAG TPA: hypothetical protein PKD05_06440, partial [Candidatus Melainabacteria bacterium]|nr:hypothetical protein [Candidatus Melainabacteria bacterium]